MLVDITSICYNEEVMIQAWIDSWLSVPFVNKIYLVDAGSTDKTLEIAKEVFGVDEPTQQDLQGSAIQLSTMFLSAWGTRTKYKKRVTRKIMPGRKLCFIDTVWVLDW